MQIRKNAEKRQKVKDEACAGLQGRAERVAEQWRRKPKPRKAGYGMRLRPDFYQKKETDNDTRFD